MSRHLALLLTVAIAVAAAAAFRAFVVRPYLCNRVEAAVERRTMRAYTASTPEHLSTALARANLVEIKRCRDHGSVVALLMLEAANQRILGRLEEAATAYVAALSYDRRPEIYLNLGLVQLQLGKRNLAVPNLRRALQFNPHVHAEIRAYDPALADELARKVNHGAL